VVTPVVCDGEGNMDGVRVTTVNPDAWSASSNSSWGEAEGRLELGDSVGAFLASAR
jgi:hypothetical protein